MTDTSNYPGWVGSRAEPIVPKNLPIITIPDLYIIFPIIPAYYSLIIPVVILYQNSN